MALTIIFLVLFVVGGLYVWLADDPGRYRKQAVGQIGRLLWGLTMAALIGGIALFIGLLWLLVGSIWMLAADSKRLAPSGAWKTRLSDLIIWPYEHVAYGITAKGGKPALAPPL